MSAVKPMGLFLFKSKHIKQNSLAKNKEKLKQILECIEIGSGLFLLA